MSFYSVPSVLASLSPEGGLDLPSMVVAVPVAVLSWPAGEGGDGRSALVVGQGKPVRAGQMVAWCKIVAVAPAVVRRDGRIQAQGRPCDHARLGVLEEQLDRMSGPGTIERVAAGVRLGGKVKGTAGREMSVAFTLRATLLMTLMPQAGYRGL